MGKTFTVALSILGVIAVAELFAVGWALLVRPQPQRQQQSVSAAGGKLDLSDHFPPPSTVLPNPTPVPPVRPLPVLTGKEKSPSEVQVAALVAQGRALGDRGDTSTALTRLREALTIAPNEPTVISELALLYEKMGLSDKALTQWKRIIEMGEAAGIYYAAAEAKIKISETAVASVAAAEPVQDKPLESATGMSLLDVGVETPSKGAVSLKIPVKARGRIEVSQVVIQVYFYDLIDDQSVVQTNAKVSSHWNKLPADWTESDIEILDVDYTQPEGDDQAANRKYYGYVVRVYYNNQLQDVRAEPVKLLKQFAPPVTLTDPVK